MTRERRLAILMWEAIKKRIGAWGRYSMGYELRRYKATFMSNLHISWTNGCWFCKYFNEDCDRCPLRSCNYHDPKTAWTRIVDSRSTLEVRLAAIDEIIAALKGGQNGN